MKHNWTYKKLGEVADVVMGQSPDGSNLNDSKGIEFHQGKVAFGEKFLKSSHCYTTAPTKLAKGHSLLLCVRAPVGILNITDREICIGRGLCAVNAKDDAINEFLYYALRSKQEYFEKNSTGSTFKAISSALVKGALIPCPSLDEQQAIVRELDGINRLIDLQEKQLREYDRLAQSLYFNMFGDVNRNHHAYDIIPLSEAFSLITDGTHQTPIYTEDNINGYKFLSAKDVISGVIDWSNIKYIPQVLHDVLYKRLAPRRNDILLCKNGTTGVCALVDTDEVFDIYVSLALLRPKDGILPMYLVYAINNPATKEQFDSSLKGVGVPNLHLGEIRRTKIILPPLALQQSFAVQIEAIEQQKALIHRSLDDTRTLLAARMQYYFE